jgi:CheY-like chemotaxis protein/HPt (histidine-containing phosphotransfer) domain-containing protein
MTTEETNKQMQNENHILLVDDCDVNQMVAQHYLERAGYQVDIAESGRDAMDAYKRKHYDLILMDIEMPVMDGYEASRRIRKSEWGMRNKIRKDPELKSEIRNPKSEIKEVPIIAMSGHATEKVMDTCCRAGMTDCIGKPLQRESLISMVQKWTSCDSNSLQNTTTGNDSCLPDRDAIENQPPIDIEKTIAEFMGKTELLLEVLETFKDRGRAQIVRIKQHLSENDYKPIFSEAHSIKGGAGNLWAFRLSKAAAELEDAAVEEFPAKAAAAVDDLEKEFNRLYRYLEQSEIGKAFLK